MFTPAARVYHEHRGTTARILSHEQVDNIIHAHGYLHFWRCVTDPSWILQHFALLPFRAARGSLRNSVRFQLTALGRALLRLPKALAFRQASRFAYVRSAREVFRIANGELATKIYALQETADTRVCLLYTSDAPDEA